MAVEPDLTGAVEDAAPREDNAETVAAARADQTEPIAPGALGDEAVRLIRSLPRPPHQAAVAGFLAYTRAHPLLSSAQDYAARKYAQSEQGGQSVEQQFWARTRQVLLDLGAAPLEAAADRAGGRQARAFAVHLAAEALLRQAAVDESNRQHGPRRGSESGRGAAARTGG